MSTSVIRRHSFVFLFVDTGIPKSRNSYVRQMFRVLSTSTPVQRANTCRVPFHVISFKKSIVLLDQLLRHSVITQTGYLGRVVASTSGNETVPVLWHATPLSHKVVKIYNERKNTLLTWSLRDQGSIWLISLQCGRVCWICSNLNTKKQWQFNLDVLSPQFRPAILEWRIRHVTMKAGDCPRRIGGKSLAPCWPRFPQKRREKFLAKCLSIELSCFITLKCSCI